MWLDAIRWPLATRLRDHVPGCPIYHMVLSGVGFDPVYGLMMV